MPSVAERFWANVDKRGPDECWEWRGTVKTCGYGTMSVANKQAYAHRLSLLIHDLPFESRLCVLHHCDNSICVNPRHLFQGTRSDVHAMMMSKGRQVCRGCGRGSKLSDSERDQIVRELDHETQKTVAERWGVSREFCRKLKKGV